MYLLLQHFKAQIVSVASRCQTGEGSKNVVLVSWYYKALFLSALFIQTFTDHPEKLRHAKSSAAESESAYQADIVLQQL